MQKTKQLQDGRKHRLRPAKFLEEREGAFIPLFFGIMVFLQLFTGYDTKQASACAEYKHHQCGAGAFAGAKECFQDGHITIYAHKRLAHRIDHKPAQKQSYGDGEKLESIAACVNTALQFHRDAGSENHIQISAHNRYENPSDNLTDAP